MPTDHRTELAKIKRFDQLIAYLRDEMGWPIARDSFEDVDDLFYDFTADELGIDPKTAAKIQEIKRLRPLSPRQPWGIFFVKFEPKKLPVVALRRILSQVALKKRASANSAERAAWAADDLLFVSNYGEGDERQISFAHFSKAADGHDLPTLKVLGWDNLDTALHLDDVAEKLTTNLAWPKNEDPEAWREQWRAAFTLRHREVVTTSKELSIRLAELARAIRDRIKTALAIETETGPLTKLMKAFQEALVHDLDANGFADMYAQTIAYGLLSARIADPHKKTADDFAGHMRTNPFLRELMETFLKVGGRRGRAGGPGIDFDELGVSEVVDLLDDANMEAVVRDFGDRNRQEDPVVHFYELFLTEYDKQTKIRRGVFYTPQPVVSYIVRSVHELLQTEFGLADGLADITTWGEKVKRHPGLKLPPLTDEPGEKRTISPDEPFVQILDPATGTATFLVEVIDVIHRTLLAKWKQQHLTGAQQHAAWNDYVPKHLLPRLHAFELMMAPYAIAHMKIGLKLAETGYRFSTEERARIYLTNALEPWQRQLRLPDLEALAHEATAVNEIKREKRFTVVIGNPPYAGHSSNKGAWVSGLVHDYYFIDGVPLGESNTKWLQDDYVKFIRLSQHLLTNSGVGVLGFITNHGFVDNPTFRGMRKSLLDTFADVHVLDLHGNTKKKERAPDGTADENIFDIQQGVSILVGVSGGGQQGLRHSHLYGTREGKYAVLRASSVGHTAWHEVRWIKPFYLFKPQDNDLRAEYQSYVALNDAMPVHSLGVVTARDDLCIQFTKEDIWKTVTDFAAMKPEDARESYGLGPDARDWQVKLAQRDLVESGLEKKRLRSIYYRPFDWRWTYYTGHSRGFHCMPRGEVMRHMLASRNLGLSTTRSVEVGAFSHVSCANSIIGHHCVSLKEVNYLFPLWLSPEEGEFRSEVHPNFSLIVLRHFGKDAKPENIFHYAYAVFHSPGYRNRYAEFLKIDFPRLPLTGNLELFRALSRLGGELVGLHLLESPKLAQPITEFIGSRNFEVEKVSWSKNTVWVDKAQTTGFKGVREDVWNFHIGGYQVCEKWLKDRKGRTLSMDDVAHYQKIVVALNETIRLMKEIDAVIDAHGGWPGAFQTAWSTDAERVGADATVVRGSN
jgi:predicted helicase